MKTTSGQDALTTRPAHTPGPFDLRMGAGGSGGLFVRDALRRLIAGFQTTSLSDDMLPGEGEANAQLFIAAGDMLAALKELVRVVGGTLQGYGILEAPMRTAEAAIAKAERGQ